MSAISTVAVLYPGSVLLVPPLRLDCCDFTVFAWEPGIINRQPFSWRLNLATGMARLPLETVCETLRLRLLVVRCQNTGRAVRIWNTFGIYPPGIASLATVLRGRCKHVELLELGYAGRT